jgi:hypothetical protein
VLLFSELAMTFTQVDLQAYAELLPDEEFVPVNDLLEVGGFHHQSAREGAEVSKHDES